MRAVVRRVALVLVVGFTVLVFGLFAWNFYCNWASASDPDAQPGIIFERKDRPGYS